MPKPVYGKDTRLAMKPIKQKKRRYYTLVFLLVFAVVGSAIGYTQYQKHMRVKAFNHAMALMEEGLKMDDYPSLEKAEQAIREEAKKNNPRVEAVAYDIILRCWIWFAYTGEEVLMSDCRKYLAFLKEPLVDPETKEEFPSPYKDEAMTAVADAVYMAVYAQQTEAQAFFGSMHPAQLTAGEKEFWLGVAHWRAGEWAAAENAMRGAVKTADTPHHRFGLARVLDLGGKAADAQAEYEKVLQANSAHNAAEAYLLLLTMPVEADAVAAIDGFIKKYEGQVTPRIGSDLAVARANALFLRGEPDKALSTINRAKGDDPWYAPLRDWQPPQPPAPPEGEEGEGEGDEEKA